MDREKSKITRRKFIKQIGSTGLALSLPQLGIQNAFAKEDASLEVMIGQMLLVGFNGLTVDNRHPIVQEIRKGHIGGVVLFDYNAASQSFDRNIQSPEQVRQLVAQLQAAAPTPLIVSIDQEGGTVCRLKTEYGFPATVSAQWLGRRDDLDLTEKRASQIARILAALGINLNLAPVVDLNTNPMNPIIGLRERSFSPDPDKVTEHARRYIQAHHKHGVLCTLKHFPGHGSSTDDSHNGLVDITDSWSAIELEPYRNLIDEGLVDAIMTAHVFNSRLDETYPATLSKAAIDELLRQKLKYDGIVISDDMQMGAIRKEYRFEEAILKAIDAGVDILAIANNNADGVIMSEHVIRLIIQFIQDGKISKKRIRRSYEKIIEFKTRLLPITTK